MIVNRYYNTDSHMISSTIRVSKKIHASLRSTFVRKCKALRAIRDS